MVFIPLTEQERAEMLARVGVASTDELFEAIPAEHRFPRLDLPPALAELEVARHLAELAASNRHLEQMACFVGAGAYYHSIPSAVAHITGRSEFYTAYTPYQAEASQGTLQFMFEFQSLACELLGLDVANASVYDGSTALAEAVLMAQRVTRRDRVLVADSVHPEYRAVLRTYLGGRGLDLVAVPTRLVGEALAGVELPDQLDQRTACVVVQQPDFFGHVKDFRAERLAERVHAQGALLVAVVAEPVSLGLLAPPGAWGADIAVAEGQALGVPLQFGGPWAGLMACRQEHVRQLPGRIVGQTVDMEGRRGFVLTLQAREQHIRREKATSNICTSQTLLTLAITAYLSLMGPAGLREVARQSHAKAAYAASRIGRLPGYRVLTAEPFFNEFAVACPTEARQLRRDLLERGAIGGLELGRFYPRLSNALLFCCTEMNTRQQIDRLVEALAELGGAA
ncbi:MAG: aminomethyl-transferring glycine dehydrogenase subunit GcvPA [Chloroflexi bacterium]|nr:aminomethyl-transferring glycine dehydrogenase subunit GcvPA [Chloroflexota bacterium]